MLQRLPVAFAQVKQVITQIGQIVCSLYQWKEIIKKVYNNIIKSIQWNCKYKNGYNIYELRKQ